MAKLYKPKAIGPSFVQNLENGLFKKKKLKVILAAYLWYQET